VSKGADKGGGNSSEEKALQRLGPPHWSASALLETGSQSGYVRPSHLKNCQRQVNRHFGKAKVN